MVYYIILHRELFHVKGPGSFETRGRVGITQDETIEIGVWGLGFRAS